MDQLQMPHKPGGSSGLVLKREKAIVTILSWGRRAENSFVGVRNQWFSSLPVNVQFSENPHCLSESKSNLALAQMHSPETGLPGTSLPSHRSHFLCSLISQIHNDVSCKMFQRPLIRCSNNGFRSQPCQKPHYPPPGCISKVPWGMHRVRQGHREKMGLTQAGCPFSSGLQGTWLPGGT